MVTRARSFVQQFTGTLSDNPAVLPLYVTTLITMLGQGLISPILPLFAKSFGVGATAVGFAVGVFGLARLGANLPAGLVGQRFGHKRLLVAGPVIVGLSTAASGLAPDYHLFLVFRFLAGVGSSIYMTSAITYLADISTRANRARMMSMQQGSLLIGITLGPVFGGLVAHAFGLRAPFLLMGVVGCISGLWCLLQVKPPPKKEAPVAESESGVRSGSGSVLLRLLSSPSFLAVSLFSMAIFFTRGGSLFNVGALRGSDELGLGVGQLGFVFGAGAVATFIATLSAGTIADRFGRKAAIAPASVLAAGGLALMAWSGGFWTYMLAQVCAGVGLGISGPAPAAYAADLAPQGQSGLTMGLFRTFSDVGLVVGPTFLGWLSDLASYNAALVVNGGIIVLAGLVLMVVAKETAGGLVRRPPDGQPVKG